MEATRQEKRTRAKSYIINYWLKGSTASIEETKQHLSIPKHR
jgi:hypothetical protein